MRELKKLNVRALALSAAACLLVAVGSSGARAQGGQGGGAGRGGYQPSEGEVKAAQAVQQAADAQAAVAAAGEYLKKYGKSPGRGRVGLMVAEKIRAVQDASQRAALAESASKLFDRPEEVAAALPMLVGAYIDAKRYDDAFRLATPDAVVKFDDPLAPMITLTTVGAMEAQKKNGKYVQASQQLGLKAVEIIEGGTKPANLDDAHWADYKSRGLADIYQALAVLSLATGNQTDARARVAKAAALNSGDPNTYILAGAFANDEYQQTAQQYQAASGAAKDELLKKAHTQLDQVIEAWAHAVALTEGEARFDATRAQLMQDLESYYKYRHGSTEGLQQLIDKYKKTGVKP